MSKKPWLLVLLMLLIAWRAYAQCCGSWPPVRGVPMNTPTPSQTPTPTVTGTLPATFTPTATTSPTPTSTASGACAFHEICDDSALTSVNSAANGQIYSWVNPQLAKIIDTANAGGTNLVQDQVSQYLFVHDFAGSNTSSSIGCVGGPFNEGVNIIPDDAVILGMRIQIRGCEVGSFNPPTIEDVEMLLVVGGVIGSVNHALSGGWDTTYNCVHGSPDRFYGSASDLWGFGAISGLQMKAIDFGLVLSVKATGGPVAPSVDGFAFTQICYKLNGE